MKIYFAASVRAGRDDVASYDIFIQHLKKYGEVLTEHLGLAEITSDGERLPERNIHDRDFEWLLSADIVVAEVTTPSLGVGYEIGRAVEHKKRILCLHRPTPGKRLSGMIAGSPEITTKEYHDLEEAKRAIDEFFEGH